MKRLNNKQNGMTFLGFGTLLILLAMLTSIGLKLFPVYLEHFNVTSILDSLSKEGDKLSADEIKPRILNNFIINDVVNVDRHHINVKRISNNKYQVTIDYEVRRNMMGNVDFVVHFVDSVELKV